MLICFVNIHEYGCFTPHPLPICKSQRTPASPNTSSHSEQHLLSTFAACESAVRHGVQFGAADTLPSVLCCVVAEFLADSTTGELLSESSTGSSRPSPTPSPGTCCLEVKLDLENLLAFFSLKHSEWPGHIVTHTNKIGSAWIVFVSTLTCSLSKQMPF